MSGIELTMGEAVIAADIHNEKREEGDPVAVPRFSHIRPSDDAAIWYVEYEPAQARTLPNHP